MLHTHTVPLNMLHTVDVSLFVTSYICILICNVFCFVDVSAVEVTEGGVNRCLSNVVNAGVSCSQQRGQLHYK